MNDVTDVNAVCVEQPIPHVLTFTEFRLRQFSGVRDAERLDLDRALADFSFMPVVAEHILHKSSDVMCHVQLPPVSDWSRLQSIAWEAARLDASQAAQRALIRQ